MPAILAPPLRFRGVDNNGQALVGGLLSSFIAGTSTPQATYVDSTQTTQNLNPIQLDARGECNLWLDPTKVYKFVLTDQFSNPIWTQDQVQGSLTAALINYTPPGTGAVPTTVAAKLAQTVSVTDFNAVGDGATNNFAAFINAAAYCKLTGKALLVPSGNFVIDTTSGTINLSYITIWGQSTTNGSATPAAGGSVISIKGTANSPFTWGPGVSFRGLSILYPDQVDSATPIVYPPTIATSLAIGGPINFCYVENCTVFNAYRFFVHSDATGAIGHVEFNNNVIYGILTCYEVAYNTEIIKWQGNNHTFGHFLAATEGGLRGYTRANGAVLQMPKSDGFMFSNNLLFGYLNGVNFPMTTGLCQLFNIESNLFDQVRNGILASGAGNISGGQIDGNSFFSYNTQNTALAGRAINISTSGTGAVETLSISGNNFSAATADEVLVSGSGPTRVYTISDNQFNTWAAFAAAGSFGALNISGGSTSYVASGNVFNGPGSIYGSGVIGSPNSINLADNTFLTCYNVVNVTTNNFIASNNLSFITGAATSDVIVATNIYQVNNQWDKASGSTTRPQMTVRKNASQTFATGATNVAATFAAVTYDKAGNWNSGTSVWTAKQAGRYRFTWMLMHDNTATAGQRWTFILTPSVGPIATLSYVTIANFNCVTASCEFDLPNAATVQLLVSQVAGVNNLVTFNDSSSNFLCANLIE